MAKINLLPWREELRAERKRQSVGILALSAIVGVLGAGAECQHRGDQGKQLARHGLRPLV